MQCVHLKQVQLKPESLQLFANMQQSGMIFFFFLNYWLVWQFNATIRLGLSQSKQTPQHRQSTKNLHAAVPFMFPHLNENMYLQTS